MFLPLSKSQVVWKYCIELPPAVWKPLGKQDATRHMNLRVVVGIFSNQHIRPALTTVFRNSRMPGAFQKYKPAAHSPTQCVLIEVGSFSNLLSISSLFPQLTMTKTRCGPKSQYTDEQDLWLDEAKAKFMQQLGRKHDLHWEAKWKRQKATEFVEKFASTLDGEHEKWEKVTFLLPVHAISLTHKCSQRISTLLKNAKHRAKIFAMNAANEDFKPLISFDDPSTGRKLFEKEHKDDIIKHAESGPSSVAAANYQSVLKNLWDSLTEGERTEWEQKAESQNEASDTERIFKYGLP